MIATVTPRDVHSADDDERRALAMLEETGAEIVTGVARHVPVWVVEQVERVLLAWGRLDAPRLDETREAAILAGAVAARRVTAELGELLRVDPELQASTPLEIVRTIYREPTGVLAAAGVPPVVRDAFDERAWPEDVYGLVPRTFGDLGDEELAPLHLAWGLAKATVLRCRAVRRP